MTKRIKQSKAYYITRNDFNQHPDIWCPASKKKTFRKYIASIGSDRKEILGDERDATFIVIVLETRPQPHSKHIQYEYVAFHEAAGIYRTRIYMHTCVCALCSPQIRAFSSRALLSLKNMSFCADTPLQFFFIRQAKYEISGRNRRMESEKRWRVPKLFRKIGKSWQRRNMRSCVRACFKWEAGNEFSITNFSEYQCT